MLRCRTMHLPKKNMLRILDTVSEKVTVWQGWIENKVNQKRFYFSWNTTTHYKICNGCMGEPLWWLKCNRFSFPHIPSKIGAFLCSGLQGWAPSQLPNSRPSCAKNTTAIRRRPAMKQIQRINTDMKHGRCVKSCGNIIINILWNIIWGTVKALVYYLCKGRFYCI